MNRRAFLRQSTAAAALAAVSPATPPLLAQTSPAARPRTFRVWATSDPHVGTDLRRGRECLTESINDSERGGKEGGPPFDWDIALMLGDFLNCSALSKFHAHKTTLALSRLMTFTEGGDEVLIQCYLHTSAFGPQGWYAPAERRVKMGKAFRMG